MEHLAQDLSVALEESESCGPGVYEGAKKWGFRRRTLSTGNIHMSVHKSGDYHSDDSSSSNSEMRIQQLARSKLNQSDSDELSLHLAVTRALNKSHSLKVKQQINTFLKGKYNRLGLPLNHSIESDSLNEHSPARPMRRKRKLRRINIDENPIPPCGKRKRPQRLDAVENYRSLRNHFKIKPLHPSITNKIQQYYENELNDCNKMETQCINDNCDGASESSLSWSGGEGHEGDDELTDWAPPIENAMDQSYCNDIDPREIRAGCRRLREERPSYSISTGANERVARFLQDSSKSELHLYGVEREKLGQLAALYSLDMWFEEPGNSLLRKTNRTPCMQPTQRHHGGFGAAYKRIRTHNHIIS